jgi:hypothetical protein
MAFVWVRGKEAKLMSTAEESTAREDSHADDSPRRLVLDWVWPTRRRQPLQEARLEIGRDPKSKMVRAVL